MIDVLVLRALMYKGVHREAHAVLNVPEVDAFELIATGRAELVDPANLAAIRSAVEQQNAKLCPSTRQRSPWRTIAGGGGRT